jgi:tetratricopeptide (TPR) repeat protein
MIDSVGTSFPLTSGESGGGIAAIAKYNPHLWSAEELRAIFVVRKKELATILQILRSAESTTPAQHLLITGQRGMGKSTLLQRVALAIEDDQALNKIWLPLRFPEEQYTVATPAELWENVIGALGDALERSGAVVSNIDNEIARLRSLPATQREDAALAWLKDWSKKHERRLVLLVDSTDLLFANISASESTVRADNGSASALWRIRKTLLHSAHLLWIGGSYQPLEFDGLYNDAFLEFFQLLELRPLTLEEMQTAILAMARVFGVGRGTRGAEAEAEIRRVLLDRPERLRAMRLLTGGIPRTTVMLYELFAAGGKDSIRSDLERLLDAMTPLYKARLESLADQQRKVLAHVMERWAPLTAKDIADAAAIPVSAVSTQLHRLERLGLINKAPLSGTKRFGFECSERFFNIWYLMRNAPRSARARVGWLVEFMRLWYSTDELQTLARRRLGGHRKGLLCDTPELEFSRAVARALPEAAQDRRYLEWSVFQQARRGSAYRDIFEVDGPDKEYSTFDQYLTRFESARAGLENVQMEDQHKAEWIRSVLRSHHFSLARKLDVAARSSNLSPQELAVIEQNLAKARERDIANFGLKCVERLEEAVLGGRFAPDCPDSSLILPQLEECFEGEAEAASLALSCVTKARSDDHVNQACEKIVGQYPDCALAWKVYGDHLQHREQTEKAEVAYRKAIALNPRSSLAWAGLASLLSADVGKHKEAEFAIRQAIELEPTWPGYWGRLGDLLAGDSSQFEDAEHSYRKAVALAPEWAKPLTALAGLLARQPQRWGEAESILRKAMTLDPTSPRPRVLLGQLLSGVPGRLFDAEQVLRQTVKIAPKSANSWAALGGLLAEQLSQPEEAERAMRLAISFAPTEARYHALLGRMLANKVGRYEEAEVEIRKAIDLDPKWDGHWSDLGDLLCWKLDRPQEAEQAYRKAIELDPQWSAYWAQLGDCLGFKQNRLDEAEAAFKKAIEMEQLANYWARLCDLYLTKLNKADRAEESIRKALALDPSEGRHWMRLAFVLYRLTGANEAVISATKRALELSPENHELWSFLGEMLSEGTGDLEEAERAFRKSVELAPESSWAHGALGEFLGDKTSRVSDGEAELRKAIELDPTDTHAWAALGNLLVSKTTRFEDAEVAFRKAIELNPNSADDVASLAELLGDQLKRYEEAETLYRRAIELDPTNDRYWGLLGDVVGWRLGRTEEAVQAYHKALELDPKWVGYWFSIALLYHDKAKSLDKAEKAYRAAIAIDGTDSEGLVNFARLLAVQGKSEEAALYFREALKFCDEDDYYIRLQCNCWLGNQDEAMLSLEALCALAADGDKDAFQKLMIQASECHEMGISDALLALMRRSKFNEFLQPLILALHTAAGHSEELMDAPAEVKGVAEDIKKFITS